MANGLTYKRVTTTPLATKQLAATLAAHLRPNDVVVLIGDLGAGKTQFVQGIADGLGVKDQVTSPTFNIQVTYDGGRLPLHHFDLYRLEQEEELDDIMLLSSGLMMPTTFIGSASSTTFVIYILSSLLSIHAPFSFS